MNHASCKYTFIARVPRLCNRLPIHSLCLLYRESVRLLIVCLTLDVVVVQNFRVHHYFPCVNREICIVKRPIELLVSDRLVGGIVVGRQIFVGQTLRGGDPFSRVKDQHLLEKIDGCWIGILEFVLERLAFSLGQGLHKAKSVLAANGLDHILGRRAEQFGDDGELIDVILAREERLPLEHLSKNATCTPDIDFDVVFLPREHDFWCTIVSC